MFTKLGILALGACLLGIIFLSLSIENPILIAKEKKILLSFREANDSSHLKGSDSFQEIMTDASTMGSTTVLSFIVVLLSGSLFLYKEIQSAMFVLVTASSGSGVSILLKNCFNRPRPDFLDHHALVGFSSYPSGHVMSATIIYCLIVFLGFKFSAKKEFQIFVTLWSVVVLFMISVSRIYLGVHWPTDVLAGILLGVFWFYSADLLFKKLTTQ